MTSPGYFSRKYVRRPFRSPPIDVVVKVVNREPVVLLKPAYEANIQSSSVLLARDTTLATVTMMVYLELGSSAAAFTLPTDEQDLIRNLSENRM